MEHKWHEEAGRIQKYKMDQGNKQDEKKNPARGTEGGGGHLDLCLF
jgi:hypothetical protein